MLLLLRVACILSIRVVRVGVRVRVLSCAAPRLIRRLPFVADAPREPCELVRRPLGRRVAPRPRLEGRRTRAQRRPPRQLEGDRAVGGVDAALGARRVGRVVHLHVALLVQLGRRGGARRRRLAAAPIALSRRVHPHAVLEAFERARHGAATERRTFLRGGRRRGRRRGRQGLDRFARGGRQRHLAAARLAPRAVDDAARGAVRRGTTAAGARACVQQARRTTLSTRESKAVGASARCEPRPRADEVVAIGYVRRGGGVGGARDRLHGLELVVRLGDDAARPQLALPRRLVRVGALVAQRRSRRLFGYAVGVVGACD